MGDPQMVFVQFVRVQFTEQFADHVDVVLAAASV